MEYKWFNHILTEGKHLCKSLGTLDLLWGDELLRSLIMSSYSILGDFLELKTETAHPGQEILFFKELFQADTKKSCFYYLWVDLQQY